MWRGICRACRIARCLRGAMALALSLFVGAVADFSDAVGAVCAPAGACAVAGGLADGAFGAGALVGACAQTGAAINAANATPLNRRFIVSTSRMVANPPIAPEVANGDGCGFVQRLIDGFVARQCT